MARDLIKAMRTSEKSWFFTQSEGGAATGPNLTTAPRLDKKSITIHASLISHCARIWWHPNNSAQRRSSQTKGLSDSPFCDCTWDLILFFKTLKNFSMAANLYGHSFAMATERALATSMANLKSSAARKEKKKNTKKLWQENVGWSRNSSTLKYRATPGSATFSREKKAELEVKTAAAQWWKLCSR